MLNNNQDFKPKEPNLKEPNNDKNQKNIKFDLEGRVTSIASKTFCFLNKLPNNIVNIEIKKQLIRSITSIGANYIEANEGLGKKDFIYRLKVCRKETKESIYWFNLLKANNFQLKNEINIFINEIKQYIYIFTAIIIKIKNKNIEEPNKLKVSN